jgi:hypothetical protein
MCGGAKLQGARCPATPADIATASPAQRTRAATVSSESIASPPSPAAAAESCAGCGSPLAGDQRYCLECGERRAPASSLLLGGPSPATSPLPDGASLGPVPTAAGTQPSQNPGRLAPGGAPHGNALTVIAGVGVLLLAMGVGVLIGRFGGGGKPTAAAPQVISVGNAPAAGPTGGGAEATPFTDDWPSGTNGYTIQLQTLPRASTQPSAVEAAKSAAGAKGAKGVGALRSEDFSGLRAGSYIVYSGVYHSKAQAEKALGALRKSFPGASVIKVSSAGGSSAGTGSGSGSGGGASGNGTGSGSPGSSKALEELHKSKGKSYEEKSKNLPNVVGT